MLTRPFLAFAAVGQARTTKLSQHNDASQNLQFLSDWSTSGDDFVTKRRNGSKNEVAKGPHEGLSWNAQIESVATSLETERFLMILTKQSAARAPASASASPGIGGPAETGLPLSRRRGSSRLYFLSATTGSAGDNSRP